MTLLILAGTGEALRVAARMAEEGRPCAVWLPDGQRLSPQDWPVPCHRGTLAACLSDVAPQAVLDASHPFAGDISQEAAHHCARHGLSYLLLRRPEWRAQEGDLWTHVASDAEAVRHIAPGSTVLVASGREGLAAYAALADGYVYCRQIGAPDVSFPLPNGEWLVQQPPFPVDEEAELFRRLGIDWLVLRNAGSARAATKLTAARALGINVAMIARPAPPDAPRVETETEALAWVRAL
ncbi:precorrin-6A/cobalt-precorrin-6A reductase [Roseovarius sp. S4756]|uniref:precorrin-6A/cobalt-precorrin-6A reductase n=1 Tax=Roseovarius maritimus TaxID=3342637 RepID=UPI00372AF7E0